MKQLGIAILIAAVIAVALPTIYHAANVVRAPVDRVAAVNLTPTATTAEAAAGAATAAPTAAAAAAAAGGAANRAPASMSQPTQVSVTLKEFSITATPATVPAGDVTFTVKNAGTMPHEMVVIKTDLAPSQLPLITASDPPVEGHAVGDVNEDKLTSPGETGDFAAGLTKTLTLHLAAGHYILMCNLPGHFKLGMYKEFTVEAPAASSAPAPSVSAAPVSVTLKEFSIVASPSTVPAGDVKFTVKNAGTMPHEMVVIKTDLAPSQLPLITADEPPVEGHAVGDVDEDKLDSPGETGDFAAGLTKTLTLHLDAGHYILMCNLPGHFKLGMETEFTVQ